jgi:hypothetical protein
MRTASVAVKQAIRFGAPFVLLAWFDLPGGEERYWSGVGTREYDGQTWNGIGGLASVSGVASEAQTFIQQITFSLVADEAAIAAQSMPEIRGREGVIWLAFLDGNEEIIRDPVEIVSVTLDTSTRQISEGTQSVTMVGQTGFYTLEQPTRFLSTNEEQQFRYPGDTGWDRAPGNTKKEITWGPS